MSARNGDEEAILICLASIWSIVGVVACAVTFWEQSEIVFFVLLQCVTVCLTAVIGVSWNWTVAKYTALRLYLRTLDQRWIAEQAATNAQANLELNEKFQAQHQRDWERVFCAKKIKELQARRRLVERYTKAQSRFDQLLAEVNLELLQRSHEDMLASNYDTKTILAKIDQIDDPRSRVIVIEKFLTEG